MFRHLAIAVVALAVQASSAGVDLSRLSISAPTVVTTFSTAELRGFPIRMTWSADGQIYLRMVQRDRWGNEKDHHYVLPQGGARFAPVESEPAWSAAYWSWKSALGCPGAPDWKIDVETRVERKSATNAGAGGGLAQNSGDPYGPGFNLGPQGQAVIMSALQSQQVTTTTLKLHGALLGEFVNTPAMPGLMYGWAAEGAAAIAYGGRKRALVLADRAGHRNEVPGTRGVLLPMWSPDGCRLAWLSQVGRGKFQLLTAEIHPCSR